MTLSTAFSPSVLPASMPFLPTPAPAPLREIARAPLALHVPKPSVAVQKKNLPFVVRAVSSEADLVKAASLRAEAYGRHVPEFAQKLGAPEAADYLRTSTVLIAESKLDGEVLGTIRIQTNADSPLALEQSFDLPDFLRGKQLVEATRLGIVQDVQGRVVRTALFKAFYLYGLRNGLDWFVITARRPMDRIYEGLRFSDVKPGAGYVPMAHVGDMPHRVMGLGVLDLEPLWKANAHPLNEFFFATEHADLKI